MLPNIFVETVIEYHLIQIKFKITAFIWNIIIFEHLNVTFDQFTAPLLNININFFTKSNWPQPFGQ